MFVRQTDDVTTALARLGKSAEWEVIVRWLNDSRENLVQASFTHEEAASRHAQGGIKVLDELIRLTTAAVQSKTSR